MNAAQQIVKAFRFVGVDAVANENEVYIPATRTSYLPPLTGEIKPQEVQVAVSLTLIARRLDITFQADFIRNYIAIKPAPKTEGAYQYAWIVEVLLPKE